MYRSTVPTRPVHFRRAGSRDEVRVVDFAAIVPLPTCEDVYCDGCDGCARSWWTPRTADLLHSVTALMLDVYLDNTGLRGLDPAAAQVGDLDLASLTAYLPPVVAAHATAPWVARFLGCFADLLERMEDGELPLPRCTGEEMALHLILDAAREELAACGIEDATDPDAEMLHVFAELQNELPRTPEDYDFDLLSELLFEDHDVLMLFDAALDGIEADPALGDRLGLVNLHFADWFEPFDAGLPVPPLSAGYRRGPRATDTVPPTAPTTGPNTEAAVEEFVFTTTQAVTNRVTDPRQLIEHALAAHDWPMGDVLDDLGLGDRLGLDLDELPDLFAGPAALWEQLSAADRRSLCRDAVLWIGGSGTVLFEVPGAPSDNNITRIDDHAIDVLGRRIA